MVTNYQRGVYYERRARQLLEAVGYTVSEARGSHGPFDLVAIGASGIRLIQVKSGVARLSPADRETIAGIAAPGVCSKELWKFPEKRGPVQIEWL